MNIRDRTRQKHAPRRRRLLVRHRVRERIQAMILNGERAPGAKLAQQQLAEQLGDSRPLVREALMEMKSLGLVETIDNRGAVVSQINEQTLRDCYEVREMFEGLAARLCCDRITRVQLRELSEMVQRMRDLTASGRHEESAWLDRQFHLRLIEIAGNSLLSRLSEQHWALGKMVTGKEGLAERTRAEHAAILKAIESGAEAEAERAARAHIASARSWIEQRIATGAFEPRWIVSEPGKQ
ncbi:MAG: GntR family transcriptional regulator [Verrucomicrobia bacterium]|nr:GntR family transcriptional regulator [Verrucomicrobiota bacterium]